MNSFAASRRRWGDNDRYLGPFTFSFRERYRHTAIVLSSGEDEYPGASFRVSAFGTTVIVAVPQWLIRPYREKTPAPSWDAATVRRMGRDWYWAIDCRQFGFSISDGLLSVYLGRQTHDSSTDRTWSKFLPWTQWRHVRHSFYDLDGNHLFDEPQDSPVRLGDTEWRERWDAQKAREATVPTAQFEFDDFDGERIVATGRVEEREWRFGTKRFKWLSLFRRPKILRSLHLEFSKETGRRKGSWKGGTLGHATDMRPVETPTDAFRRYCAEHEMTFVGPHISLTPNGAP